MSLDQHFIRHQLGDAYTLEYHEEVASTNDLLQERARADAPAGTVVYTEHQTAGRGRRGSQWVAPAGTAVLCSVLLRPSSPIPPHHLAILTGVGAANGLNTLDIPAKIKWPNDLIVEDRKVGGILVETAGDAVVVGVGINCTVPQEAFPKEFRTRAGSLHALAGRDIPREDVLTAVIRGVSDALASVEAGGVIKVLYAWNTLNWLKRRRIRVCGPMGAVEGDGLFLDGRKLVFHVFKDYGVVPMPLSSSVEVL